MSPCVSCGQCIVVLPHRRADREGRHLTRSWAALRDPSQACRGPARAQPCAPPWANASACPSAPTWRARWSPRCAAWALTSVFDTDTARRLHHHGGGHRVHSAREKRRHTAPDHLLLARAGSSSARHYYPGPDCPTCPPANPRSRCPARLIEDLVCPERWASTPTTSSCVSVMPCTAKKFEIRPRRHERSGRQYPRRGYLHHHP